jgi:hypothetical protein
MRNYLLPLSCLVAAGLCACGAVRVQVKNPAPTDWSKYRSYAFIQRPPGEQVYGSLLADNELIYGLADQLAARDIVADTLQPDLLVSFRASAQWEQREVTTNQPQGWGMNPWRMPLWGFYDPFFWNSPMANPWWGAPRPTRTVAERQGTLEVYVFDRHTKQTLWQAVSEGNATDAYENVKISLKKMFAKFPVKAKRKVAELKY